MSDSVCIVIPAFCPTEALIELTQSLLTKVEYVLVINDGSPPECKDTFDALPDQVEIINHATNLGKGAAIKTAIRHLENTDITGIITVDADGQHIPEDVFKIIDYAKRNQQACVLGVRNFKNDIPFRSKFGNEITLVVLRFFYGLRISDSQTGLRYLPKSIFTKFLKLEGNGYEFELQCLLELQSLATAIVQIPISTIYIDDNSSSHFRPIKDSIRIYSVFLKFSLSSVFCFALDIVFFSLLYALTFNVWLSTAIARLASGATNFIINRSVVFNSSANSTFIKQVGGYFILWLGLLVASAFLVESLSGYSNQSFVVPFKILIDSVLFIFSYKIQKRYIFSNQKK